MDISDVVNGVLKLSGKGIDQKDVGTFISNLHEAQKSAVEKGNEFLAKNNAFLQQVLLDLSEKKIDTEEFAYLLEAQKISAEQWVNTLSIKKQVKAKQISIDLLVLALKLVVTKI